MPLQEINLPQLPLDDLTDNFIRTCIYEDSRPFASGAVPNNHVNGGFEEVSQELALATTEELLRFLRLPLADADFIAPVPNGANGWAFALQEERKESGLIVLTTEKQSGERRVFQETDETKRQLEQLLEKTDNPRGIVLDDVTSDGGTNEALAEFLEDRGLEITLVMSILYRGAANRIASRFKRAALLRKYIPLLIDWELYEQTGEVAALSMDI